MGALMRAWRLSLGLVLCGLSNYSSEVWWRGWGSSGVKSRGLQLGDDPAAPAGILCGYSVPPRLGSTCPPPLGQPFSPLSPESPPPPLPQEACLIYRPLHKPLPLPLSLHPRTNVVPSPQRSASNISAGFVVLFYFVFFSLSFASLPPSTFITFRCFSLGPIYCELSPLPAWKSPAESRGPGTSAF